MNTMTLPMPAPMEKLKFLGNLSLRGQRIYAWQDGEGKVYIECGGMWLQCPMAEPGSANVAATVVGSMVLSVLLGKTVWDQWVKNASPANEAEAKA